MARASIALAALSPTLQAIRRKEPYDSQTLDTTQQDTYQTSPSSSPALVALPLASSRVRRSRTPSLSSRRLQALPTSGPGLAPPSNLSCYPWLLPSESRSVPLASHAARGRSWLDRNWEADSLQPAFAFVFCSSSPPTPKRLLQIPSIPTLSSRDDLSQLLSPAKGHPRLFTTMSYSNLTPSRAAPAPPMSRQASGSSLISNPLPISSSSSSSPSSHFMPGPMSQRNASPSHSLISLQQASRQNGSASARSASYTTVGGSPLPQGKGTRTGTVSIKDNFLLWTKKWMVLDDEKLSIRKSEVRPSARQHLQRAWPVN